jgi:hypothetical protein
VISFTPQLLYPRGKRDRSWVDPRSGLDDVEKRKFLTLPGLELRPLGRPARSQSLYRLRYPGSAPYGTNIYKKSKVNKTLQDDQVLLRTTEAGISIVIHNVGNFVTLLLFLSPNTAYALSHLIPSRITLSR